MKGFSTEGHPERFTELHEEEEREEGDRDEQEEKKGDSRGERQIYPVFCSLSILCSPETHRDSQNWIGKKRGWGGGSRSYLREKRESQKCERVINTLLNRNGN